MLSNFPFKLDSNFLPKKDSKLLFNKLLETVEWERGEVTLYGKTYPIPRLQAWFGDDGANYSYSGMNLKSNSWSKELLDLKNQIEKLTGYDFNSVLVNLYRDAADSNGWHRDNEKELGSDPIIASVSLGENRLFKIRNKKTKEVTDLILESGSLLIMSKGSQLDWEHTLPKSKKIYRPRINLTFRKVLI